MESKHWSTGYTLITSHTKRWSSDEFARNDEAENKMIFENFTPEDNGKGRKRIATCENKEDAAHIVKCVNAHDELVMALQDIVLWTKVKNGKAQWESSDEKITELKELLKKATGTTLTNKETLSPTLQKKYNDLWDKK